MTTPAATKADVIARAAEFASVPDSTITLYLSMAVLECDAAKYSDHTIDAQAYYCAHLLTCQGFGVGGYVPGASSVTVGPSSKTWASGFAEDYDLARTVYGQRFKAIRGLVGLATAKSMYPIVWEE